MKRNEWLCNDDSYETQEWEDETWKVKGFIVPGRRLSIEHRCVAHLCCKPLLSKEQEAQVSDTTGDAMKN